jgi:flagellar hook assembly protein FlgD
MSGALLEQNEPNPFNPRTTIAFEIPNGGGDIQLKIYDLRGRLVRELVDEFRPAGNETAEWDGRDGQGRPVSSGAYLYVLSIGGERMTRKMVLLR